MALHPSEEVKELLHGVKLKQKVIENLIRTGTENLWHSQKQNPWLPALCLNHNKFFPVRTHTQIEAPVNRLKILKRMKTIG